MRVEENNRTMRVSTFKHLILGEIVIICLKFSVILSMSFQQIIYNSNVGFAGQNTEQEEEEYEVIILGF